MNQVFEEVALCRDYEAVIQQLVKRSEEDSKKIHQLEAIADIDKRNEYISEQIEKRRQEQLESHAKHSEMQKKVAEFDRLMDMCDDLKNEVDKKNKRIIEMEKEMVRKGAGMGGGGGGSNSGGENRGGGMGGGSSGNERNAGHLQKTANTAAKLRLLQGLNQSGGGAESARRRQEAQADAQLQLTELQKKLDAFMMEQRQMNKDKNKKEADKKDQEADNIQPLQLEMRSMQRSLEVLIEAVSKEAEEAGTKGQFVNPDNKLGNLKSVRHSRSASGAVSDPEGGRDLSPQARAHADKAEIESKVDLAIQVKLEQAFKDLEEGMKKQCADLQASIDAAEKGNLTSADSSGVSDADQKIKSAKDPEKKQKPILKRYDTQSVDLVVAGMEAANMPGRFGATLTGGSVSPGGQGGVSHMKAMKSVSEVQQQIGSVYLDYIKKLKTELEDEKRTLEKEKRVVGGDLKKEHEEEMKEAVDKARKEGKIKLR
jgi:hypothetical protein